jgi:hypothetical protein
MKRVILVSIVAAVAAITPGADAELGRSTAPPGLYLRLVKYGSGGSTVGGCTINSATTLVSEQNASSRWPAWHPVSAASFDVEQTLNIGSQSSGSGSGRITFNPFSIKMVGSSLDATLFELAATGTPLCEADLLLVTSQGPSELFSMRLAAVKTAAYAPDTTGHSTTTVTFQYGGLLVVNQSYSSTNIAAKATAKMFDGMRNVTLTPPPGDTNIMGLMP